MRSQWQVLNANGESGPSLSRQLDMPSEWEFSRRKVWRYRRRREEGGQYRTGLRGGEGRGERRGVGEVFLFNCVLYQVLARTLSRFLQNMISRKAIKKWKK